MFATQCGDVAAVVPFYGNLKTTEFARRPRDPVDVAARITAAVEGHYSNDDPEIPAAQLNLFERQLDRHDGKNEFYTYDAPHGFFAYPRQSYREAAATLAWKRTVEFLRRSLQNHD